MGGASVPLNKAIPYFKNHKNHGNYLAIRTGYSVACDED